MHPIRTGRIGSLLCSAVIGGFALIGTCPAGAQEIAGHAAFRRFFAAEATKMEGTGSWVKAVSPSCPPGKYLVWVRCLQKLRDAPPPRGPGELPDKDDSALLVQDLEKAMTGLPSIHIELGKAGGDATLAGTSSVVTAWTVLDAPAAFQTVSLSFAKAGPGFSLSQVYLSGDTNDLEPTTGALDLERIWRASRDPVPEEFSGYTPLVPPRTTANRIRNGSFEVGVGNTEWCTAYQSSYTVGPHSWNAADAADGRKSLCVTLFPEQRRSKGDVPNLPAVFSMMHKALPLAAGTPYRFRGLFKADAPVTVTLAAEEAGVDPLNAPPPLATASMAVSNRWQELQMDLPPGQTPRPCHLKIGGASRGPARLWIDALTLTEQPVTAFIPSEPVEVGVHWTAPGKLFYADEPVVFSVLAHDYGEDAATFTVRCRVVDFFDQVLMDKTFADWRVEPAATSDQSLTVVQGRTGAFRLLVDGSAATAAGPVALPLQEYVFSILPRPPAKMKHSYGAYITLAPEPISIMSRAGIRKTTTLSSKNELLCAWKTMEPAPGKFVWADRAVAHALSNDVAIVANLDFGSKGDSIPAWARIGPKVAAPAAPDLSDELAGDPPPPELDVLDEIEAPGNARAKTADADSSNDIVLSASGQRVPRPIRFSGTAWSNFVETVTAHYKGAIEDWLILDEPYHCQKAGEYADLLKLTYPAAKRGNPGCRVWAHGGYYPNWLPALEKAGVVSCFDVISDYARDPGQAERLKTFARRHGKRYFNVEYGWHASMYRTLAPSWQKDCRLTPYYQGNAESVVAGVIRSVCWSGSEGFGRYDARYPGGDFTQLDAYKCLFEYDGALKPAAVAYAVLSQFLDGFRGEAELALNPDLSTFLLTDDTRFAVALWSRSNEVQEVVLPLPAGVQGFDIMANPLPAAPAPVLLAGAVTYLIGPQAQLEATTNLLRTLTPSTVAGIHSAMTLDEKLGQYVATVTITNLSRLTTLTGKLVATPDPAHNFYGIDLPVSPLKPGQSAVCRFALNLRPGDPFKPTTIPLLLSLNGVRFHHTFRCELPDQK